jgi:hypothetical protein
VRATAAASVCSRWRTCCSPLVKGEPGADGWHLRAHRACSLGRAPAVRQAGPLTRPLLQATCKRFWEFCTQRGVDLPPAAFTMSYETCIPRQAGLSGSSAIVCAALSCLLDFYGVAEQCVPAGNCSPGERLQLLCPACLVCLCCWAPWPATLRTAGRGLDHRPLPHLCQDCLTPAGTATRLANEVHDACRADLTRPVSGSHQCSGPCWC